MVVHIYHQSISWDNMVLGWRGIIYHWGEEEEMKIPMGNPKEILFSLLKDMTESYLEDFDKK